MDNNPYKQWIDLGLLLATLILGYLLGNVLEIGWVALNLPFKEDWPIQWPEIIGYLISFLVLVIIRRNDSVTAFLNEVALETSKVVWPTPKETGLSTVVIIVMVGVAALLLYVFDFIWGSLVKAFFNF